MYSLYCDLGLGYKDKLFNPGSMDLIFDGRALMAIMNVTPNEVCFDTHPRHLRSISLIMFIIGRDQLALYNSRVSAGLE